MQTFHHQSRVALIKIIEIYVEILDWLKSLFSLIFAFQRLWQWLSESVCASDGGQARHRENQIFINYWMSCLLPFIFYRLFILSICLVMCMLMLRGKVCRSDGGADWLWTAPMIYHCPCPPVHNASGVLKMISHGQQHHHNFHFSFSSGQKVAHGRDCTPEATFRYEQSFRLLEKLISSTHWPDAASLFNTNIFVWVTILKGFFIHWKITFYDWHLVTLRIVLVSRMTWRVGKLTTLLPATRGI